MKMCNIFDFDWMGLGMAGALAEEMAEEEKNKKNVGDEDFDENADSL
jgi:hypothetical protein